MQVPVVGYQPHAGQNHTFMRPWWKKFEGSKLQPGCLTCRREFSLASSSTEWAKIKEWGSHASSLTHLGRCSKQTLRACGSKEGIRWTVIHPSSLLRRLRQLSRSLGPSRDQVVDTVSNRCSILVEGCDLNFEYQWVENTNIHLLAMCVTPHACHLVPGLNSDLQLTDNLRRFIVCMVLSDSTTLT